jgi:dihydropteroate synthase
MHTGGAEPRKRPHRVSYDNVTVAAVSDVTDLAGRAMAAGVAKESIIIDPGHDFGKNTYHSLQLTRDLAQFVDTGWPVLVSLSNKDFVGESLDVPVDQRLTGTLAATSISAWLGAQIFRVHNVAETRQTLDMVAAIAGLQPPRVARRGLA